MQLATTENIIEDIPSRNFWNIWSILYDFPWKQEIWAKLALSCKFLDIFFKRDSISMMNLQNWIFDIKNRQRDTILPIKNKI